MRRALYASGGVHAAVILWVAVGGSLFAPSPDIDFEVTGVTLLSTADFDALVEETQAAPSVSDTPATLAPAEVPTAPEVEPGADTPPAQRPTEAVAPPEPDTAPEPVAPVPQTEVTDTIAALPAPPPAAPDLPPSDTPVPDAAPRVAPVPTPAPPPEAETAPEVLDRTTDDSVRDDAVAETPQAAPEEATTEIVTEAEEPAGAIAPVASIRPPARPERPPPPPPPAEPELSDTDAAVAAALAETPAPTSAAPSGPPLSAGAREGFRVAVQACWNVGALSSEALRTTVVLGFDMARDGRPDTGSIRLIEASGGSDAAAQQAFEAARRAIIRCGVNGYDLPLESYDRWQQVELVFNPDGMRLR